MMINILFAINYDSLSKKEASKQFDDQVFQNESLITQTNIGFNLVCKTTVYLNLRIISLISNPVSLLLS